MLRPSAFFRDRAFWGPNFKAAGLFRGARGRLSVIPHTLLFSAFAVNPPSFFASLQIMPIIIFLHGGPRLRAASRAAPGTVPDVGNFLLK